VAEQAQVGEFFEQRTHRQAGVVDQQVEPVEFFDGLFHQSLALCFIAHVHRDDQCLSAALEAFRRHLLQAFYPPGSQDHFRPLAR
jgi:hypothetical protein